ncbi:unnamed protein product [Rhodiola kirilowii]
MKSLLMMLSLLFLVSHLVMADDRLITSTCNRTPFPNVCISNMRSDPRSASANTAGLGAILVDKISSKTNQAEGIVKRGGASDPRVVQALNHCAEAYNAVLVADVPMAIEAFTKGNPKFAEQGANDARGEAESCERGFPRGTSPVSGLNNEIGQLAAVVAAIARSLE